MDAGWKNKASHQGGAKVISIALEVPSAANFWLGSNFYGRQSSMVVICQNFVVVICHRTLTRIQFYVRELSANNFCGGYLPLFCGGYLPLCCGGYLPLFCGGYQPLVAHYSVPHV